MQQVYITELRYSSYVDFACLSSPAYLRTINDNRNFEEYSKIKECSIYLICSRPKVSVVPKIEFNNYSIYLEIEYKVNGELKNNQLRIDRSKYKGLIAADKFSFSSYPYSNFNVHNGDNIVSVPISWGFQPFYFHDSSLEELKNVKVLYVGMSHADSGNKHTIVDRLNKHSTLQLIMSEHVYNFPDDEILIYMYKYNPYQLMTCINPQKANVCSEEEDSEHVQRVLNSPITSKQQTAINEASLIQYFKPKYNCQFVHNFPCTNLKCLREVVSLDLHGIDVEIDSSYVHSYFYSDFVMPKEHHTCSYNLTEDLQRDLFFGYGKK